MLFRRNIVTALTLTAALMSASAFADENSSISVEEYNDYQVKQAVHEVKQNLMLDATHDVLTASHTFETELQEGDTLIADITITPLETLDIDNNDA